MASAKMTNGIAAFLAMAERRHRDHPSPEATVKLFAWRAMSEGVRANLSDRKLSELADKIGLVLPRGMGNQPRKRGGA